MLVQLFGSAQQLGAEIDDLNDAARKAESRDWIHLSRSYQRYKDRVGTESDSRHDIAPASASEPIQAFI